ncbi:MAG TPA: hypothetical protein VEA99_15185, partial [Gemmatimonadaceae bacterium]|nr:hypothetical protein [Gemmatimonadaceae bacterium]
DARDYFGGGGSNPASADIRALGDACKASDQAAATAAGWEVLSDVGAAALARSAVSGAPAAGGRLVSRVLAFMAVGTDGESSFTNALSVGGMFRVREAGNATTGSRNGAPDWRINATWTTRTLVYGWRTTLASGGTQIDELLGRYEIDALPAGQITPTNRALVAYCAPSTTFTNTWVQHNTVQPTDSEHEFLEDVAVTGPGTICAQLNVATVPRATTLMLAAAERALARLMPTPLWALTERVKVGGVGGFSSDLSPFFVANLGAVVAQFVQQPADDTVSTELNDVTGGPIRVLARTGNGGVAIPRALVRLAVDNNSGEVAGAYLTMPNDLCDDPTTVCAMTDRTGVATFTGLRTNKAGGYLLGASVAFDGLDGLVTESTLFQVKNK